MRVLVTGGAGFIGSHTVKALAAQDIEPVTVDNLSTGTRESVKWGTFIAGDIGDRDLLRQLFRYNPVNGVIHFAASAYVGESVTNPGKYFRNNVSNMLVLLETMVEFGVRTIVFSSSCATYGIPETLPITEQTQQRPVNPYGETKLFGERMLQAFGEAHGMTWVAARYFNAAGADLDGELGENHDPETHLIPLVIDAATGMRPNVAVLGTDYPTPDGTAIRDFIHVNDLADAHIRALRYLSNGGPNVAVNLGTGIGYSVSEIISAVSDISGANVPVKEAGRRSGDPAALVADPGRAREILGWSPQCSDLETIVRTAWDWRTRHGAKDQRRPWLAASND